MMWGHRHSRILLAASASVFAVAGFSLSAEAQDFVPQSSNVTPEAAPPREQGETRLPDDGEIIVTAQRREERLQDVPIAISAVTSDDVEKRGTQDLTALSGSVPALTVGNTGGVSTATLVSIRGISGQPVPIGAGLATAFYLDGVYLPRTDAGFWALNDIERIEVLRGPQGTLYGRNATAGAISIITRLPGDVTEGNVDVSYGNFNAISIGGSFRTPLGGGLSAGISGSYQNHEGYYLNSVTNRRFPGREQWGVRGKLRYLGADGRLDLVLAGDITKVSGGATATKAMGSPTGVYVGFGDPDLVSLDAADRIRLNIDSKGVAFTANFEASDDFKITSVTSLRKLKSRYFLDVDGSAAPAILLATNFTNRSVFQELRGLVEKSNFRATFGANYFGEEATYAAHNAAPSAPVVFNNPYDETSLDSFGFFGQFEFDVLPTLTLVAGGRYSTEKRDFLVDYTRGRTGLLTRGTIKDDKFVPSVGVNFKPADDLLLYAKFSQGYQAPGFNYQPGATTVANVFAAEDLDAYEAGIKSQFLDRRVTLNLSGFYYKYSNIQVRNNFGTATIVQNAAGSTIKGVEGELNLRVAKGFTLRSHAAYISARYTNFCQPFTASLPLGNDPTCGAGLADRSGNYLNQAPKWSGGLSADYRAEVADAGEIGMFVGYSWESNSYYSTANETGLASGGWDKVDARLSFQLRDGPELYLFARNLTDRRYRTFVQRAGGTILTGALNDPQTYGIGIRYGF